MTEGQAFCHERSAFIQNAAGRWTFCPALILKKGGATVTEGQAFCHERSAFIQNAAGRWTFCPALILKKGGATGCERAELGFRREEDF